MGLPFGVFGSFSYRRDFASHENGETGRYGSDGNGNAELNSSYEDAKSTETVNWSGMVNLAYQLRQGHEVGFNFLYNQNSEKVAQQQVGTLEDDAGQTYYRNRLIWTERNLQAYQLKGTHALLEDSGIKFDWLAALATTSQLEPDVRFFNYSGQGEPSTSAAAILPIPSNRLVISAISTRTIGMRRSI